MPQHSMVIALALILVLTIHFVHGATTKFEIHLTSGVASPVGAQPREVILVNGTFIGPTLHLSQGDDVEFLVRNYMRQDTSIHFHGIAQASTPWSDGVPGLTQKQVKPGASFLYRWRAEESGTYFYHAHSKAQIMDGMYGAIVIKPSSGASNQEPFDLISADSLEQLAMEKAELAIQPIFVSDWSHQTSAEFHAVQAAANVDMACTDAIIVNGVGAEYCLTTEELDQMTHPLVLKMLRAVGEQHLTAKGCIPPYPVFQGDFDLRLDQLPPRAFAKCEANENPRGNYSINANSTSGFIALSFINPGGLYPLQLAIDGHELIVFAVDGHYIVPVTADRILVNTGSRISVLIKLNQKPGRYTVRIANDYLNQVLGAFAELAYDGSHDKAEWSEPSMDFAGHPLSDEVRSFIPEQSRPYPAVRPSRLANATFKMELKKLGRPYGAYEWTLTGTKGYNVSQEEERTTPMLLSVPNLIPESELVVRTEMGQWVDIVLVTKGPFAQAHPMHKHGNRVYLIGSGSGSFPWHSVQEAMPFVPADTFNLEDPPLLDTFNTVKIHDGAAGDTWTIIRYHVESPGAWLFHCHVQTHLSGGMGLVILDGIDAYPNVPEAYREWNGFEQPSVEWR